MSPTGQTKRKLPPLTVCLGAILILVIYLEAQTIECAPNGNRNNNSNNNNNGNAIADSANNHGNRLLRTGLLSSLFRRQTSSNNSNKDNDHASSASNESPTSTSASGDPDDPAAQTEMEAQKFLDSLPGAGNASNGPTSFRERVSESWDVLRDGVSNQFKSLRDNWSETVEDLRDTWTGSSE